MTAQASNLYTVNLLTVKHGTLHLLILEKLCAFTSYNYKSWKCKWGEELFIILLCFHKVSLRTNVQISCSSRFPFSFLATKWNNCWITFIDIYLKRKAKKELHSPVYKWLISGSKPSMLLPDYTTVLIPRQKLVNNLARFFLPETKTAPFMPFGVIIVSSGSKNTGSKRIVQ